MAERIKLSINKENLECIVKDNVLNNLGDGFENKTNSEQNSLIINEKQPTNCPTCRNYVITIFDIGCLSQHYETKEHMINSCVRLYDK